MYHWLQNHIQRLERTSALFYPRQLTAKCLPSTFFRQELCDQLTVSGDIVECGVADGTGLVTFGVLAPHRLVYGFDSFEGFPEPSIDDASVRGATKGEYREYTISLVQRALVNAGVTNVKLVRGFISETAPRFSDPIALLYIDLDLHGGYKDALTVLAPLVVKGGIIAFDEYGEEKWPGATKAVDEWLEVHPHVLHKSIHSNKYYLKV